MKNTFKSIGAVLAGFISVFILSVLIDMALEKTGIFPSQANPELYLPWMLMLALAYRSICTIIGGYVTAKLSPEKPMLHVFILGVLGTIAGAIGVFTGWHLGAHWYPIALALTALPLTWLGGKIKVS